MMVMKTLLFLFFMSVIVIAWFWHNQPSRRQTPLRPVPPRRGKLNRKPGFPLPPRAKVLSILGAVLASYALGA
jgi:hypothetical protein